MDKHTSTSLPQLPQRLVSELDRQWLQDRLDRHPPMVSVIKRPLPEPR